MELKFRAYSEKYKKMFYGRDVEFWGNPINARVQSMVDGLYDVSAKLMEYLPFKDKNGKQYCQDDIVCYDSKNYRLIKGSYQFELLGFFRACQDMPSDYFSEDCWKRGEIVGNIYETPHLLN